MLETPPAPARTPPPAFSNLRMPRPTADTVRLLLGAGLGLGIAIRAFHVLRAGFPLNDGGLFYQMTRDLQAAGYRLPAVTSYNDAGLPFAYPPAAFYLAGLLDDLLPVGLMTLFRLIPLVAAAATLPAFFVLARAILPRPAPLIAAVFAFALLPRSFIWMLMGGGVTRAPAFLFAILALHQVYLLYTRRSLRYLPAATALAALTVLFHLETGWFLAYSVALFFLVYGRHRSGVLGSALLAGGTLVLTSPWWGSVLQMHGLDPFLAAHETGGSVLSDPEVRTFLALTVLRFGAGFTGETLFPVVGTLAVLGVLASLIGRRPFLPLWWCLILLMDARAFPTYATLPVALLAGGGLTQVLLPALRALAGHRVFEPSSVQELVRRPVSVALGGVVALCAIAAASNDHRLGGENTFLVPLSPDERAAMRWVAEETPPESRFLVVTAGIWQADKQSEWFPVLAQRRSVATVQGYEWVAGGAFKQRAAAYDEVQNIACSDADSHCLDRWTAELGEAFTHIFVPNTPGGQCCGRLRRSLEEDPRYETVLQNGGATIYAFRGSPSLDPAYVTCEPAPWGAAFRGRDDTPGDGSIGC